MSTVIDGRGDSRWPQPRAKLLDLPTELLLEIAHNLTESELYSLSLLCVRLHHIALPIYLARHGFDDPFDFARDTLSLFGQRMRALPGLCLALTFTHVKHLVVWLGDVPDPKKLDDIGRLLSKPSLLRIEEVTLEFHNIRVQRAGDKLESHDHLFRDLPVLTVIHWDDILATWMSSLAEKSPEKLTLSSGHLVGPGGPHREADDKDIIRLVPPAAMRQNSLPLKPGSLFGPLGGIFRRSSTSPSTSIHSHRYNRSGETWEQSPSALTPLRTLRTLCIRSRLIIRKPLLNWTIATANLSPITSLSFEGFDMSTQAWGILLPLLSLQSLRQFTISSTKLLFGDLTLFLSRHQTTLVGLNVSYGSVRINPTHPTPLVITLVHPLPPHAPEVQILQLPALQSLCAPPDYIAHILSMGTNQDADMAPNLDTVIIRPFARSTVSRVDSGLGALDCAIHALAKAWQHNPHKRLLLAIGVHDNKGNFADWLESIITGLDDHRALSGSYIHPHEVVTRAKDWRSLGSVRILKLWTVRVHLDKRAMELIPAWLALLPSLKAVKFFAGSFGDDTTERDLLFETIGKLCPNLVWAPKLFS
jgi:hypothetical protein